jgi:hypothetical protein
VLRLRATLKNLQPISLLRKPAEDSHGSGDKLNKQFEGLLRPIPQQKPAEDLESLIAKIDRHLDHETSERTTIYDRLRALDGQMKGLESQTKRRVSGAFGRYLVAICLGVAVTLAWQPYAEATKQIIATRAPILGWSPGAKQMIAGWFEEHGWTKPPVVENIPAPATQTAPETVVPTVAPSLDPEQMQQMTQRLALLQKTVEQLAATQDQMGHEITRLQAANVEILLKLPAPPPPPIAAAPAVAGRPAPGGAPPSENTQNTAPASASLPVGPAVTEGALRASCGPDVQRLCRGISMENGGVIKCLISHRMELSPTCDAYFNEMPVHRVAQKGAPKANGGSPCRPGWSVQGGVCKPYHYGPWDIYGGRQSDYRRY